MYTLTYAVIDIKDCRVEIHDATGKVAELIFDEGDFSWTENYPRIYVKNRGLIGSANNATVKNDEEQPVEISFAGRLSRWGTDGDYDVDAPLRGYRGPKASPTHSFSTTDVDDPCAPYCCDIHFFNTPSCGGDGSQELLFEHFRAESLAFSVKSGTISVSGKCNVTEPVTV